MKKLIALLLIVVATLKVDAQDFKVKKSLKDLKLKSTYTYIGGDNEAYYFCVKNNIYKLDNSFTKKLETIKPSSSSFKGSGSRVFRIIDDKIVIKHYNRKLYVTVLNKNGTEAWSSDYNKTDEAEMSENGMYMYYVPEDESYYQVLKYNDGKYEAVGKKQKIEKEAKIHILNDGVVLQLTAGQQHFDIEYYNIESEKSEEYTVEVGTAATGKLNITEDQKHIIFTYTLDSRIVEGKKRKMKEDGAVGVGIALYKVGDDKLILEREQEVEFSQETIDTYNEYKKKGGEVMEYLDFIDVVVNNNIVYVLVGGNYIITKTDSQSGRTTYYYMHLPMVITQFTETDEKALLIPRDYGETFKVPPPKLFPVSDGVMLLFNDESDKKKTAKKFIVSYHISDEFVVEKRKSQMLTKQDTWGEYIYFDYLSKIDDNTYLMLGYGFTGPSKGTFYYMKLE